MTSIVLVLKIDAYDPIAILGRNIRLVRVDSGDSCARVERELAAASGRRRWVLLRQMAQLAICIAIDRSSGFAHKSRTSAALVAVFAAAALTGDQSRHDWREALLAFALQHDAEQLLQLRESSALRQNFSARRSLYVKSSTRSVRGVTRCRF